MCVEVDSALKDELAGLQRDFVTEGFERSSQTAEFNWIALLDGNAERHADFVAEKADSGARVYSGQSISECFPP